MLYKCLYIRDIPPFAFSKNTITIRELILWAAHGIIEEGQVTKRIRCRVWGLIVCLVYVEAHRFHTLCLNQTDFRNHCCRRNDGLFWPLLEVLRGDPSRATSSMCMILPSLREAKTMDAVIAHLAVPERRDWGIRVRGRQKEREREREKWERERERELERVSLPRRHRAWPGTQTES